MTRLMQELTHTCAHIITLVHPIRLRFASCRRAKYDPLTFIKTLSWSLRGASYVKAAVKASARKVSSAVLAKQIGNGLFT